LALAAAAAMAVSLAAQPASADSPPGSAQSAVDNATQKVNEVNQQLKQQEDQLNAVTNAVEHAQGVVAEKNRIVQADRSREAQLNKEMQTVARLEYQRPALMLTNILQARNLDQLISSVAQARLVAHKEQALHDEAKQIHERDAAARDEASKQRDQIDANRKQAAQIVSQTQTTLQAAQAEAQAAQQRLQTEQAAAQAQAAQQAQAAAAAQARAQAVNQFAQANASASATSPAPGSSATNPNTFAPGQCTWYVASMRNIPWSGNARDWWPNAAAMGFAEGQTPQVGSVMVEDLSIYGHVALVTAVNGSSWTVSEMNYNGPYVVDQRTLSPGQDPVIGFIYGKA
jgi:peptidoglycan DL-endopeptidase CwlO